MYKVTYYYADGTEETKVIGWRYCPDPRELDRGYTYGHGGLIAFKISNATQEEKIKASMGKC